MQCKDCPADCGMKYLPGMLGCDGLINIIPPELLRNAHRLKQRRFYKPPRPMVLTRRALQEMVSCGALG